VWITTDLPRYPQLTVPMEGRVVEDIYVVPDELRLEGDAAQPVMRLLLVQSSVRQQFKILKVEPPRANMEARVRAKLFRGYRIELRNIFPDPALDGKALVITTDCATTPEIRVPFRIGTP